MQGGSGFNPVPQGAAFDKSRVLDVKPLRSLKPIFPNANESPPFVCPNPSGPFPPGYTPFYPFSMPPPPEPEGPEVNQSEEAPTWATPPAAPAPIRAYRTHEVSNGDADSSVKEDGPSDGRKRSSRLRGSDSSSQKDKRSKAFQFNPAIVANFVVPITQAQRDDGTREVVEYLHTTFDGIRRRLSQLEDAKEVPSGVGRRADLKAGNILMSKGLRTNMKKRIGAVPGVEIGDIFFFRMEMCVVGLHSPSMGGIDWIGGKASEEEPLAVSIVSSGYYDDDAEDKDVLVYSGQGGAMTKDKPIGDQKLERGNLALERSMRRANEVRVVRGIKDAANPGTKIYVYDGLYVIQDSWMERGKSGANTFKYKLVRVPGQPEAFALWKSIDKWKENLSSRPGLILPDLTSGAETIPVSLVNDFDDEKGPAYFTYCSTPKYVKSFGILQSSYGCSCLKGCAAGDLNCACIRKNGGDLPYTTNGVLVCRRPLVYECGPSCPCGPNCKIRVSQSGLKVRLEVFKTKDRGWGLRSYDPIRAGAFICEYAGEVIDKDKLKQKLEEGDNDEYIFDSTRTYESFKWNYEPMLLGEEGIGSSEDYDIPSPVIVTAKDIGNVARFMNHSCSPNVFWQPVMYEESNESFVHIAFFAIRHIPPMTELTYDYGTLPGEADTGNANSRKKKCLCGSSKCRGHFAL